MAAASLENGLHGRQTPARHLGPRLPIPPLPPGRRYPVHGPQGPYTTDHPPLHHPRPYFYVQPMQPPPPLYHYQWPMPVPFNPYSGYPGLGFGMPGMVMPPFPPHPYTEVPGYVLPHAALHPTEYRQYQFPPAAMIYQNSRSRMFYQTATHRETANSEVQTETPTESEDRPTSNSLLVGSDSGRGTDLNTPSSPSSHAGKLNCREGESNSPVPSNMGLVGGQCTDTDTPTGTQDIGSCVKSTAVLGKPGKDRHLNYRHAWSVCSADGLVPMCSSSDQEDEGNTEGHVSSSTDVNLDQEAEPKRGLTRTHEETGKHGAVQPESSALEAIPCVNNDLKINESVWSVESLVPYVPSIDWMIQNGLMASENREQESPEKGLDHPANQSQMSFHFSRVPKTFNESVWSVQSFAPYVPSKELLVDNTCKEPETVTEEVSVSRGPAANQVMAITERRRSQRFSLTLENVNEAEKMSDEEISLYQQSFRHSPVPKKLNESVWSVQSLAGYVPSREWMVQNGVLDPEQATEKESGANVNQGLTASQVLAVTERRRSQRLSLSSVESYAPSSSWLADLGNVYYYGTLPQCSQENGNVFSTPPDKLPPSDRPSMDSEALPSRKLKRALQHDLDMEPVEKTMLDSSSSLLSSESTSNPTAEQLLMSSLGSPLPKVQCNPNRKGVDVTECTAQNTSEDPETHASKCLAGGQETLGSPEKEPVMTHPIVPRRLDCEQMIADVRRLDPSLIGDFKICGLMCSKLQQRNCACVEPMLDVVGSQKSPTGQTTEGNVTKMAVDLKLQELQQHRITHQKQQMHSRREGKGRPNYESCENGYGLNNYSKKRRQWQKRPLRTQAQANSSNNVFGQGDGDEEPWNGHDRSGKTRGANGRNKRY
ncbi:hypothetical protein DPEC_G00064340 [Dallia pectoralis]|uniref:Uncharacterized protein n=1 Tax=Dallia pectoralis TaxID=75939 RepID=A0ACC2H7T5_DALPE|nr:hypothetical protein DPEC_G00064340 [Dallia pectoralis]